MQYRRQHLKHIKKAFKQRIIYTTFQVQKAGGIPYEEKIKYEIGDRRAGDLPEFWANAEKAEKILGWKTQRTLEDMCRDTWNWQKNNPQGYNKQEFAAGKGDALF